MMQKMRMSIGMGYKLRSVSEEWWRKRRRERRRRETAASGEESSCVLGSTRREQRIPPVGLLPRSGTLALEIPAV